MLLVSMLLPRNVLSSVWPCRELWSFLLKLVMVRKEWTRYRWESSNCIRGKVPFLFCRKCLQKCGLMFWVWWKKKICVFIVAGWSYIWVKHRAATGDSPRREVNKSLPNTDKRSLNHGQSFVKRYIREEKIEKNVKFLSIFYASTPDQYYVLNIWNIICWKKQIKENNWTIKKKNGNSF